MTTTKNNTSKTKKEIEEYDFFNMGKKVAEDSYERCEKISKRLEEDFGEAAKLKFQYGFYKQVAEHSSKIFEDTISKTSIVENKETKKTKKG